MKKKSFKYESMGCGWEVVVWDEVRENLMTEIEAEVVWMADEFDRTYSRFIKDSLVWRLADRVGRVEVSSDFMEMLKLYFKFYEVSGGRITPLLGMTLSDLGYDADYSLTPKKEIRVSPDLLKTVEIEDDKTIKLNEKVLFDFGCLGKGYFVDKLSDYLTEKGFRSFMVNGSGDIRCVGIKDLFRAGLEHPFNDEKAIGVVEMREGAMASSGINRRRWREYHHLINPENSLPTEGVVATWVLSDKAATADALATGLFLCPPESFREFDFEYCIVNEDMRVKKSPGWPGEIF